MAIVIKFEGTDRSSQIVWPTVNWRQNLTYQADLLTFQVTKKPSQSFVPEVFDEVTLTDNGVLVFGGHVIQVEEEVSSVNHRLFRVACKDYSHIMDRRLVIESFEGRPVINIINEMLNSYINRDYRQEIATFENNEVWTGGSADTTNYRVGSQGRKLTSTGSNVTMNRLISINLNNNGLTTSDDIEIEVYIDDVSNLSTCVMKLGDQGLTNYYSKDITSLITTDGWNLVKFTRSTFTETGSPDATDIEQIQLEVDATGTDTVNVTFDNWHELSASDAFTRDNCLTATRTIDYIAFKYEQVSRCLQQLADLVNWQWYVDENKDIHFFAKFTEVAPFNLTDSDGDFVWRSLGIDKKGDQIRNVVIVRGGMYEGPSTTEYLKPQADGSNTVFKVGYQYTDYTLEINNDEKAVGIDNVDTFTDKQSVSQIKRNVTTAKVGDVAADYYQTQQVVSEKHGRLSKIVLRLRKVGAPTDNFQLEIVTDDGSDEPTDTAISTTATIAGASLGTSWSSEEIALTENATNSLLFDEHDKYHIRASRSGSVDGSNYYEIDCADVGDYDGLSYSGTSAPVYTRQNRVFYFKELLSYEALYALDEKTLRFNTAPSGTDTIEWIGKPYLPVLVQYRENTSILEYGVYEAKIVDESILTTVAARQRALEEVTKWATETIEGSFISYTPGLRVGQTININSTIRDINEDFFVVRVNARARSYDAFEYNAELVTRKTIGIIYYLQQRIIEGDKTIDIRENEILDRIEGIDAPLSLAITETDTVYEGKAWSNDGGTTENKLIWQSDPP